MSDGYSYRPDWKDRARRDFKRAYLLEKKTTPRELFNLRVTNAVTKRVTGVRWKMRRHIRKHKERWIHQEMNKLQRTQKQGPALSLAGGPKPPFGLSYKGITRNRTLREQARANVEHRCDMRLRTLDHMERRLMRRLSLTHKQT